MTIGIRASTKELTFAVYDSEKKRVINIETICIPRALEVPEGLKYIRNSILDVLSEYNIERAGIRVTESNAQQIRMERILIEAVVQEALASSNVNKYYCGQISNIASKIGIDRKMFKPYADGSENFPDIENWRALTKEAREAFMTALGAENA